MPEAKNPIRDQAMSIGTDAANRVPGNDGFDPAAGVTTDLVGGTYKDEAEDAGFAEPGPGPPQTKPFNVRGG